MREYIERLRDIERAEAYEPMTWDGLAAQGIDPDSYLEYLEDWQRQENSNAGNPMDEDAYHVNPAFSFGG